MSAAEKIEVLAPGEGLVAANEPMVTRRTPAAFLSIGDIRDRWSCGRTFVYEALADMERGGYLRRLAIGRRPRFALDSIETWERLHTNTGAAIERRGLVALRAANEPRKRQRQLPPAGGVSIRGAWRRMKAA
jgi:hypothetical protein